MTVALYSRKRVAPESFRQLSKTFGPRGGLLDYTGDDAMQSKLSALIRDARSREIDTVLLPRPQSLSDRFVKFVEFIRRIREAGLQIECLEKGREYVSSKMGYDMAMFLLALATEERGRLAEEGMQRAKQRGTHIGRKPRCANCRHPYTSKGKPIHPGGGKCILCGCPKYRISKTEIGTPIAAGLSVRTPVGEQNAG